MYTVKLSDAQFVALVNGDNLEIEEIVENLIDQVEAQIKKNTAPRGHKFKVGEIVLYADGQYECEVIELIHIDNRTWAPEYRIKDLKYGTTFHEFEHYLIGDND